MSNFILIDTDVLIDFFRGFNKAVDFVNTNSSLIILSPIVVAELYAGVKGNSELIALESFVSLFRVIPVTSEIARTGGLYKRDYGKSHGVGLADAIIAATCDLENIELKTLNIKKKGQKKGSSLLLTLVHLSTSQSICTYAKRGSALKNNDLTEIQACHKMTV